MDSLRQDHSEPRTELLCEFHEATGAGNPLFTIVRSDLLPEVRHWRQKEIEREGCHLREHDYDLHPAPSLTNLAACDSFQAQKGILGSNNLLDGKGRDCPNLLSQRERKGLLCSS